VGEGGRAMIALLLSFGWNWLLVPLVVWFLNGLRKVIFLPHIKLISALTFKDEEDVEHIRIEIDRRQWWPPFSMVRETWTSMPHKDRWFPWWIRLSDGSDCSDESDKRLYRLYEANRLENSRLDAIINGEGETK
jgi:hypothetical protein